jgi:aspartate/methionine/tyrosine aminotransferase
VFSRRTDWPRGDNRPSLAWARRSSSGLRCFDLTETNPTTAGLATGSVDVSAPEGWHRYEPEPFGRLEAREAVAAYHGHRVEPGHVVLTSSTSEAYAQLFALLCDPGDRVLVPAPSYPLFDYLARLASVDLAAYPSWEADGWHVDLDRLESLVDARTRAVVVVSPNHPTGALLHRHEHDAIASLCARRGLALLSDEVFADYLLAPSEGRVETLAGEERCLTFVLSGLSKVCLAPGWKVGWVAVSGPAPIVEEALHRLEVVADTSLSVNAPAQRLLPGLLARRAELQAPLMNRLRSNRTRLRRLLDGTAGSLVPADGGWSFMVRLPASVDEEAFVLRLIERDGVRVHPGYFFDVPRGRFLVASGLVDEHTFGQGATLLAARLSEAAGRED